ncbi:vomeronasal type-1 receptor 4-like [Monodelphis domestica]|uniref:vomeronasal type-1 receptor 4-like n=1 Tax=Monodelphis domestica TaxID=13616 RepID=UPI0024E1DB6D|nr:vomeronasal type-1 receptor 4-like [Monodelphis domestica]
MSLYDIVLGIIFFSQTGVGVLGNSLLFCFYVFTLFSSHRSRLLDPILVQLTLTNTIVLLSKGCPLVNFYFGDVYFLGNLGCQMVFYFQRMSRGLAACTTCLLSIFQAVTISPSSSRLAKHKVRVLKLIRPSCLLCWIFNMIIEVNVPFHITGSKRINSSHTGGFEVLYCYWEKVLKEVTILPSLRDILCVGGMVWASGYIIVLLYRHQRKVQHIHRTSLSQKTSPEIRATQTILLLLSIFVSAYCISCGFTLYKVYVTHSGDWLVVVSTFTALCFPTISPFLLIHRDSQIFSSCCASWQKSILNSWNSCGDFQVDSSLDQIS